MAALSRRCRSRTLIASLKSFVCGYFQKRRRILRELSDTFQGFRFLEHMTDAEIEACGANIDEAFQNAGRAVEQLMVNLDSIDEVESRVIKVSGRDLESLLYDWIEALITIQDEDGLLFSSFVCKISKNSSGYFLLANALGEKFDPEKHEQKTAIKAPTFYDMKISVGVDKVIMRFLVDL